MKREDDEFGRRLREAGGGVTPAFSEAVHRRVMSEVGQERAKETHGHGAMAWRWGAVAAGMAVAAVIWVSMARRPAAPQPPAVEVALPAMPSLGQVVREAVGPVGEKMREARFAYLDRDGKRLAKFLWRSVPGVPEGNPDEENRMTNQ